MRRPVRWGLILLVLIGWAVLGGLSRRGYVPPAEVRSFDAFLEHFGPPDSLGLLAQEHLIATIPVSWWYLLIALPSARPAYVFDRSGRLIDFSTDPGDDQRFQDRWSVSASRALTLEQAEHWLQRE